MYQDPAKFAEFAGKNVAYFSKVMENDANNAIKMVLKSLNEKGGFEAIAPIFAEMGLSGRNAVNVLSTLASKMEQVNEAQKIANFALRYGSSVTQEYGIKNYNLQAQLFVYVQIYAFGVGAARGFVQVCG
jgi:hypothetical protein